MVTESKKYGALEHVPACSTWPPPWLAATKPAPLSTPGCSTRPVVAESALLALPPDVWPGDLPPDLYEFWQERAAIRQFDGGLPWWKAEALALADVLGRAQALTSNSERDGGPALEIPAPEEATRSVQTGLFVAENAGPYARGL
jgi:hypothetical protein